MNDLINRLLQVAVNQEASLVYVTPGQRPLVKMNERWRWLDSSVLNASDTCEIADCIMPQNRRDALNPMGVVDFEIDFGGQARFHMFVFQTSGVVSLLASRVFPETGLFVQATD